MKMRLLPSLLMTMLIIGSTCAHADDDAATALAKKSQNPVEKMISLPLNSDFNFGYGEHDNTQYILNMKPVVPFSLNDSLNLITRTIIPLTHQPDDVPTRGYINGLGDINPTFFFSPAHPGAIIWGVGPALILPTATNQQLGQGKYSVGPSFVVLTMPDPWVIGVLASNVWSVGGQSNRPAVNQFSMQYFINYNFPHGWFVTSQPIITANWEVDSQDRWAIPFGAGVGHVFKIGKQSMSASVQAYDYVKTPVSTGPNWQLQLDVSLLFPDS